MPWSFNVNIPDLSDGARIQISASFDNQSVDLFVQRRVRSKVLLITFHGAVNTQMRSLPVFLRPKSKVINNVNLLSVSDPLVTEGVQSTWYAGSADFPLQNILPSMFNVFMDAFGVERVVLFGGSSGGYAALYYGSKIPKSVAVVCNPQTDLLSYKEDVVDAYRVAYWPSTKSTRDLGDVIDTCAGKACKAGTMASVIYLQNVTDYRHFYDHFLPFANSMAGRASSFIPICSFWGKFGHSGSVPADAYLPWLEQACISKTISSTHVLEAMSARQKRQDCLVFPEAVALEQQIELSDNVSQYLLSSGAVN